MSLRGALAALNAIQLAVIITDPIDVKIAKAYPYMPPGAEQLGDVPCFMNTWTLEREVRTVSLAERFYNVRMQMAVEDADSDQAADIATALFEQFMADLRGGGPAVFGITLDGNVTRSDVRGNSPTLIGLLYGGKPYIGIDMVLDFSIKEAATFLP